MNNSTTATCQFCGKPFTTFPSRLKSGAGKYCSRKCADMVRRKQIVCICEMCGEPFTVRPSEMNLGSKFCSRECYKRSRDGLVECICQICGKSFSAYPSIIKSGRGKFCSKHCMGISQRGENHYHWRGGHSNYRGPNWNQQRKAAYSRDKGVCQYCGKKPRKGERRNEVHHIKRFDDFNGDYVSANQLLNLITLCQHCHQQAEHGKIPIQPYLV